VFQPSDLKPLLWGDLAGFASVGEPARLAFADRSFRVGPQVRFSKFANPYFESQMIEIYFQNPRERHNFHAISALQATRRQLWRRKTTKREQSGGEVAVISDR